MIPRIRKKPRPPIVGGEISCPEPKRIQQRDDGPKRLTCTPTPTTSKKRSPRVEDKTPQPLSRRIEQSGRDGCPTRLSMATLNVPIRRKRRPSPVEGEPPRSKPRRIRGRDNSSTRLAPTTSIVKAVMGASTPVGYVAKGAAPTSTGTKAGGLRIVKPVRRLSLANGLQHRRTCSKLAGLHHAVLAIAARADAGQTALVSARKVQTPRTKVHTPRTRTRRAPRKATDRSLYEIVKIGTDGRFKRRKKGQPTRAWQYRCKHDLPPATCIDCNGSGLCRHKKARQHCSLCGGASICEHNRQRKVCVQCKRNGTGGASVCKHFQLRYKCLKCGKEGKRTNICAHNNVKTLCKECKALGVGGKRLCEHNRERIRCKLCYKAGKGGASSQICEHLRERKRCRDCKKLGQGGACLCKHLRRKGRCKICDEVKSGSTGGTAGSAAQRRRRDGFEANTASNITTTSMSEGGDKNTGSNAVEDFGSYQHVNGAAVLAAVATNIIHGDVVSHFMV